MRLLSLCTAVVLSAVAFAADDKKDDKKAKPPELAGKYDCVGGDGDGAGEYKGTVEISEEGAGYKVEWTIGDSTFNGVGVWENDRLCVSWQLAGECKPGFGVIVYTRGKDGTLKGKWTQYPAAEKLKEETLTPQKK